MTKMQDTSEGNVDLRSEMKDLFEKPESLILANILQHLGILNIIRLAQTSKRIKNELFIHYKPFRDNKTELNFNIFPDNLEECELYEILWVFCQVKKITINISRSLFEFSRINFFAALTRMKYLESLHIIITKADYQLSRRYFRKRIVKTIKMLEIEGEGMQIKYHDGVIRTILRNCPNMTELRIVNLELMLQTINFLKKVPLKKLALQTIQLASRLMDKTNNVICSKELTSLQMFSVKDENSTVFLLYIFLNSILIENESTIEELSISIYQGKIVADFEYERILYLPRIKKIRLYYDPLYQMDPVYFLLERLSKLINSKMKLNIFISDSIF